MKLEDVCKYLDKLSKEVMTLEICGDESGAILDHNDDPIYTFDTVQELEKHIQEQTDAGSEPKDEAGTETCKICGCENREHYSTCTIGFPESSLGRTGE